MKKRWLMIATIIGIILIGGVLAGPIMSNVEEPDYEVIASQKNIEVRRYVPMIIAKVEVEGQREDAIGDGFRLLADYIFGNNQAQKDIAMTAPVQQQQNTTIAMTVPVQQQAIGNSWQVSFVMPAEYTIATLPRPNNDRVKIKVVPPKTCVVIRFSGRNSDENVKAHERQLMDYVKANNIAVISSPRYAFYNPPWTLPPMRRNEVMIEIDEK